MIADPATELDSGAKAGALVTPLPGPAAVEALITASPPSKIKQLVEAVLNAVGGELEKATNTSSGDAAAASAGPKVPANLQPFTNPGQSSVIPSGWVSQPGRIAGSTIYYPHGTDPSAPGSTYIRVMPPGSTPVPELENGYWVSIQNGQPINPAAGGTETRGQTSVVSIHRETPNKSDALVPIFDNKKFRINSRSRKNPSIKRRRLLQVANYRRREERARLSICLIPSRHQSLSFMVTCDDIAQ